jgi:hypothetical protein
MPQYTQHNNNNKQTNKQANKRKCMLWEEKRVENKIVVESWYFLGVLRHRCLTINEPAQGSHQLHAIIIFPFSLTYSHRDPFIISCQACSPLMALHLLFLLPGNFSLCLYNVRVHVYHVSSQMKPQNKSSLINLFIQ